MFLALSPADTARTVLPENKQKPRTVYTKRFYLSRASACKLDFVIGVIVCETETLAIGNESCSLMCLSTLTLFAVVWAVGFWENAPETVHLLSSPFVFWTPHTGACCAVSGACCLKFQRPGPQPTMLHAMFLALSPADTARTGLPENKQKPRTV